MQHFLNAAPALGAFALTTGFALAQGLAPLHSVSPC